ncbi:MAG: D-alanyl-D-alanine carboxypeptidase family protein [Candidatus Omnitrophica bacterium]|nr:D-alanyl-D-alanine carboxypeptidase family protein [Candidatus Omnitrophota bacterium]
MKILSLIFVLGLAITLTQPIFADFNKDKLNDEDIVRVQNLLAKLEPLIKEREAAQSLATLTFDEVYSPLNEEDKAFLKEFQNLKGDELGVTIPYRQIATGKENLVVMKNQKILLKGEPYVIPPQYLPPNVCQRYLEMMQAMEKDLGKRLYVESGYRSSAYQLYLFVYYLKNHDYSIRETTKWVALPGYSEHGAPQFQAIDFISADGISGEEKPEEFENLEEYKWLLKNANRFNFILSYPRGKPGITFEPWHWHYEE